MARRVRWAEEAWHDLERAAEYIRQDSPRYAAAFVREVRDAGRSLVDLANRGRIVPEFRAENVRELFVRSFRLIYRVTEHDVERSWG